MIEDPYAARFSPKSLLTALEESLERLQPALAQTRRTQIVASVEPAARTLFDNNTELAADEIAKRYLYSSSVVLAFYNKAVSNGVTREDAREIIGDALRRVWSTQIRDLMKGRLDIDYDRPEEAFDRVAATFKPRGEEIMGAAIVYDQEVLDAKHNNVGITRCMFNDFFRKNGALELMPLFCALDGVWADELNAGPFNVRFHRPSLLSEGADRCRFYFTRRDQKA